ncbi:MAG: outer membrane beta-barrel protein [Alphaproteobacteria bacterium]|nr:outer membrane beta-barrel protein [Alphaproteobacteria bacterium]
MTSKNVFHISAALALLGAMAATPAQADDYSGAAPAPVVLAAPVMSGPLKADPNPWSFNAGQFGRIYAGGIAGVMGLSQDNSKAGDKNSHLDIANAQAFIQSTGAPWGFYAQAGVYSLPALGTSYLRAAKETDDTYGLLPVGYISYAASNSLSVKAGKLPTLLGDENTFTFQNMNIARGLLWGQENAINRGVEGDYSAGPMAFALSWNDGFYSNHYSWLTGRATYNVGANDVIAVDAGGNLVRTDVNRFETPVAQNNSKIFDLMYTHTSGQWTLNPYIQYTYAGTNASAGIDHTGSSFGAAFLANYKFDALLNIAGRAEYISTTGNAAEKAPNLLYGQGSKAWSLTLTPTYQVGPVFARAEASYVHASSITAGDAFGSSGKDSAQARMIFETGLLF